MRELAPGTSDDEVLDRSYQDSRILLTHNWGFGNLVVRLGRPTVGLVIIAIASFGDDLDRVASDVTVKLIDLGDELGDRLTVMHSARIRQRKLIRNE